MSPVVRMHLPSGKPSGKTSAKPGLAALLALATLTLCLPQAPAAAQSLSASFPAGGFAAPASSTDRAGGWPFWGGSLANTHASLSEQTINVANAPMLTPKWVFTTKGDVSATPTVGGGSVYVPDWGGYLYRIDAATGKTIWSHALSEYSGNPKSLSRNSPALGPTQAVFGDQAGGIVYCVDRATGALLWKTTLDTSAGAVITSSPVIAGNRVYVGTSSKQENLAVRPGFQFSFRGSAAALDLRTGKILWQTYTAPAGYTGAAIWASTFVIDPRRNSAYVTTGNNYTVPADVAACVALNASNPPGKLACLAPTDYIDAVLALDLDTGKVKWAQRLEGPDTWTLSCFLSGGTPCPSPAGPDYDFGSGVNFIRTEVNGRLEEELGAGQKSGVYWALNPDTGAVLWSTQVGPGGPAGGIQWGSATDERRVYAAISNLLNTPYLLQPQNTVEWNAGSWAALNAATGTVLWQVPASGRNPFNLSLPASATGQVTVANGVMYAGSLSGDMVALDAATGQTLWTFPSGGSVIDGPSIVDGTLYWGSGYASQAVGTGNNKLYAFYVPGAKAPDEPRF